MKLLDKFYYPLLCSLRLPIWQVVKDELARAGEVGLIRLDPGPH